MMTTSKDAVASVKTAGRTLDVFEAFAATGEPMSLTELAEQIKAPLSSCHALIKTLQSRGYVYVLDQRRRFYPSKRMYNISADIARRDPLLERLVPLMMALRDETGETVILGKRQGNEVIYLEVIEGTHLIRYREVPGSKKPLHCSAIGKAILGAMDERERVALLRGRRLPQMTENTIVETARLLEDLQVSHKRGFYRTRGENVADVQAIAMFCRLSGETLALALAGPIERMRTRAREQAYVAALHACIQKAEQLDLGPDS
jgi:DNA-binding IclR family transcriptional regulator